MVTRKYLCNVLVMQGLERRNFRAEFSAAGRENYETGNQSFSKRLRFLTTRDIPAAAVILSNLQCWCVAGGAVTRVVAEELMSPQGKPQCLMPPSSAQTCSSSCVN